MRESLKTSEIRYMNKVRIAKFISKSGSTSKTEISRVLGISMPTTLQYVKELIESGIVEEKGAYESTGGRKAKVLSIAGDAGYGVGVDITSNHIAMVMINACKETILWKRERETFYNEIPYYKRLESYILDFIKESGVPREKIKGIGFSVPGIVDKEKILILRSHILKVQNVSFQSLCEKLNCPCSIENDANCAAYAEFENSREEKNAVYLSLSNTVGGAIYLGNHLYEGEHFKSAEFGHMIVEKNGKTCYCGKKGCLDAYCRAGILLEEGYKNLEEFFHALRGKEEKAVKIWREYLENLAVGVSNLRTIFDCDIILGGYVGGYLGEFMLELEEAIKKYNIFDTDSTYIKTGKYKLEASACGAAFQFIDRFLNFI